MLTNRLVPVLSCLALFALNHLLILPLSLALLLLHPQIDPLLNRASCVGQI